MDSDGQSWMDVGAISLRPENHVLSLYLFLRVVGVVAKKEQVKGEKGSRRRMRRRRGGQGGWMWYVRRKIDVVPVPVAVR